VGLLFGLVPLVIFYVFAPLSLSLGLWLAFAAAFTLGVRVFVETGSVRFLDGAGLLLFGLLAFYDAFIDRGATAMRIGMIAETGLFLTALWSLWLRRPFSEQYLPQENGTSWRTNVILSTVWTITFAAMAGANAVAVFIPAVAPVWTAGAGLVAFSGALTFTWYLTVHSERRAGDTAILGRR